MDLVDIEAARVGQADTEAPAAPALAAPGLPWVVTTDPRWVGIPTLPWAGCIRLWGTGPRRPALPWVAACGTARPAPAAAAVCFPSSP